MAEPCLGKRGSWGWRRCPGSGGGDTPLWPRLHLDAQKIVEDVVAAKREQLHVIGKFLWDNPEVRFEEHKAHDILCTFLEEEGFDVKRHYILQTAFRAEYGEGSSPTVALLCEYDALPGIGHACGHNLIAQSALTAAVVVRQLMKSHEQLSGVPLQGRVVVLGTPAEEGGMGKELLLRAGALDGVDAALMAHPEKDNALRVILSARCGVTALFEYAGEEHDVQSSALDAAVLAYSGLSLIRARMDPECRMHGVFLRSEATSELEVHRSQLHFCVRAPSGERLLKVRTQLEACMEAAAKATGCNVHIAEKEIFCKHMNLNEPLLRIFQRHAEAQGLLFEDNNACRVQLSGATSDIGNVSHVVPTIHPMFGIESASLNHTVEFGRAAGTRQSQETSLVVGKALALTAFELLCDHRLLDSAREDFERRRSDHSL
ncbi:xaa-Arg dipeptidase isoform X3 [Rhipicephalus microplus]|uniref:xaa-Arg dipeptidase isoform X3 n=1 Tax=Rhipicephalus microplus TaxID=6941 RepID=UPI003F6D5CB4